MLEPFSTIEDDPPKRTFACYGMGVANITSRRLVYKVSPFWFSSETNSMKSLGVHTVGQFMPGCTYVCCGSEKINVKGVGEPASCRQQKLKL